MIINKKLQEELSRLYLIGEEEYIRSLGSGYTRVPENAIKSLEKIMSLDPNNDHDDTAAAMAILADLYRINGRYKEARGILMKLLELTDNNKAGVFAEACRYEFYRDIGFTYYLEKNYKYAMEAFNVSFKLNSRYNYGAILGRALLQRRSKQYKEARANIHLARALKAVFIYCHVQFLKPD